MSEAPQLTAQQARLLEGGEGDPARLLMRLLVRLARVYGAPRLVPVSSVQISGVSYKSIGDPGTEFLEDMAARGARVQVTATLNPAGMDLERWQELGFPRAFADKQARIIAAFQRMGVSPTVTCTPYLAGNLPGPGDHIAWAESSAVSYANSVLGARTNREGGPAALAAAVCGCAPLYGLHTEAGRRPTHHVEVTARVRGAADHGALGNHVGREVRDGIPYFTGLQGPVPDELKGLGAAMAASGAVAMYHVAGVTPEAGQHDPAGLPRLTVGEAELREARARLNTDGRAVPELTVIGCPHASLDEVARVASLLQGRRLQRQLWVCTSRHVREQAVASGYVATIQEAGGQVVADTCMVVAPIEQMGVRAVAVNSGKAAHYLPGFCKQRVTYGPLAALVEGACS